ncbi:kinesin-4-like [Dorcoceras hygrometricum]|uniref:Kinesin-4-like n=1 Tax=Dorcoceras hygrometricum TaxID=472368 RepID=A0A2Z7BJP9_9LAMI|nr:kinesin-4-like [Dorcoceras hygrometricum]
MSTLVNGTVADDRWIERSDFVVSSAVVPEKSNAIIGVVTTGFECLPASYDGLMGPDDHGPMISIGLLAVHGLADVRKEVNAKVDIMASRLNDIQKDAEATKEALSHQLLEFQSSAQENHSVLHAQLSELVDYIHRGGADKKGESGSRGLQQPSNVQSKHLDNDDEDSAGYQSYFRRKLKVIQIRSFAHKEKICTIVQLPGIKETIVPEKSNAIIGVVTTGFECLPPSYDGLMGPDDHGPMISTGLLAVRGSSGSQAGQSGGSAGRSPFP